MSDIISARCFGCGNIIKVPAGLGGKKARCPQCTNTISIPMPNDTQLEDIVSDAELPEVAREGEILRAEEGEAPIPGMEGDEEEAEEKGSDVRPRGSTSVRGRTYASAPNPRVAQRGGTQTRPRPAPTKSNSGMMIGIGLGVVALIIAAVALGGGSHGGKSEKQEKPETGKSSKGKDKESAGNNKTPGPQFSAEDQALISRLMDYAAAVNRGEPDQILMFYAFDPEERRRARIRIAQEIVDKKVNYEGVKVTSVSGGTVGFTHNGGQATLTWKQVDGVWKLDLPGN
jgi:hypothetical protein